MAPFIFGARNKIHIIDLELTVPALEKQLRLFVVWPKQEQSIIRWYLGARSGNFERAAERAGQPFVNHRWLGGMLTNWKTIRQSIKRLENSKRRWATAIPEKISKKKPSTYPPA